LKQAPTILPLRHPASALQLATTFMKHRTGLVLAIALAVVGGITLNPRAAEPARKPNIAFILIDDMGWKDGGCLAVVLLMNIGCFLCPGAEVPDEHVNQRWIRSSG